MQLIVKACGVILIMLALVHLIFPKYFNWKVELQNVSLINKQMMYVHTFFIALVLLLMGWLCLTSAVDIVHTPLGRKIALGLGIFWTIRLFIQFFGYSSALWRGKKLESTIHVIFSVLWLFLSATFLTIYFAG